MTAQEAFEKWQEKAGRFRDTKECWESFIKGIQHQEVLQILCLADIRAVLGDKEGKLMQDELLQKVKDLVEEKQNMKDQIEDAYYEAKEERPCWNQYQRTTASPATVAGGKRQT